MSIDFEGEYGEGERGGSPSKLTARQRARGNKDLQETLIALPSSEFLLDQQRITV
jgi:hypothetical protein